MNDESFIIRTIPISEAETPSGWYRRTIDGRLEPFEPRHNEWPPQNLVWIGKNAQPYGGSTPID
jgi:hypothetical protein